MRSAAARTVPAAAPPGSATVDAVVRVLMIGSALLAVLHLLLGDFEAGGVHWFHLDRERNLPTWFSSLVFALVGGAAGFAFFRERAICRARPGAVRLPHLWLPTAAVGFAMSLDEMTILHENLLWRETRWLSTSLGDAWRYVTQWQLLFAPAIVVTLLYFVLFFHSRLMYDRRLRRLALGAIACWTASLLLEALRLTFRLAGERYYALEVLLEEQCEMVGGVLLFAAIAGYATSGRLGEEAPRAGGVLFSRGAMRVLAGAVVVLVLGGVLAGLSVRRLARLEAPTPRLIQRAERDRLRRASASARSDRLLSPPAFSELVVANPLPGEALEAYFDRLRVRLFPAVALSSSAPPPLAIVVDDEPRMVFVTVPGDERTVIVAARRRGLEESLDEALSLARATVDSPEWIKIDVVEEIRFVSSAGTLAIERGVEGLAFAGEMSGAFLPGEVLARTLVNSDGEIQFDNVTSYLEELAGSRVRLGRELKEALAEPLLFTTTSWLVEPRGVRPLYRGHRLFERLLPDELEAAAEAAGSYLRRAVGPGGRFVYSYLPKTGVERDDYNILRHAGAVYSMLELYATDGSELTLAAARRALDYLTEQAQPCTAGVESAACIVEDGEVKLGGNALALLALSQYAATTGDDTVIPAAEELARWIAANQGPDGRFTVHKQAYPSGATLDFVSGYYPGEAIFALTRFYEVTGDAAWLDVAERAATYLIEVRDAELLDEELPHDHWLLYALNALHRHHPLEKYSRHALRIATEIASAQNTEPRLPDWYGSYYKPPRSTPTAIRSEGLSAAYDLARRIGREDEAARFLEAIRSGVRFQLQTQSRPESAAYLRPSSRIALGGFHKSLTDFEIRIDYVQHNLSSLLALHRIEESRLKASGETRDAGRE